MSPCVVRETLPLLPLFPGPSSLRTVCLCHSRFVWRSVTGRVSWRANLSRPRVARPPAQKRSRGASRRLVGAHSSASDDRQDRRGGGTGHPAFRTSAFVGRFGWKNPIGLGESRDVRGTVEPGARGVPEPAPAGGEAHRGAHHALAAGPGPVPGLRHRSQRYELDHSSK